MKDFVLDLKNCSKEDRKKSNGAAKYAGFVRLKPDGRFLKRDNVGFVYYELNDKTFNYCDLAPDDCPVYQVPQDWGKIKEALGIKMQVPEYIEFDGLIWENKGSENKGEYGHYQTLSKQDMIRIKISESVPSTEEAFNGQFAYLKDAYGTILEGFFTGDGLFKSTDWEYTCSSSHYEENVASPDEFEAQQSVKGGEGVAKAADVFLFACNKLGFTKEYVEEITRKGFEDFVNNKKEGPNSLELIKVKSVFEELKQIKEENERLTDVTNSANKQAALVMGENKLLIEENEKQAETIKDIQLSHNKEIERRLNYANTISEMTIEWRKNPKRQDFKNLEHLINKLRKENKNLKDSLRQYSKLVV